MSSEEDLLAEIAKKQAELESMREATEAKVKELKLVERANLKASAIRPLNEFTDAEKCAKFDELHNSIMNQLAEVEAGNGDEDDEHYAWEEFVVLVARDERMFWKYYNSMFT